MATKITRRAREIEMILDPRVIARAAYNVFRENTPYRTGNAYDRTRLKGDTIHADYKYATRLDQGSSKLKPAGMTKPTEKFISDYLKKNLGK